MYAFINCVKSVSMAGMAVSAVRQYRQQRLAAMAGWCEFPRLPGGENKELACLLQGVRDSTTSGRVWGSQARPARSREVRVTVRSWLCDRVTIGMAPVVPVARKPRRLSSVPSLFDADSNFIPKRESRRYITLAGRKRYMPAPTGFTPLAKRYALDSGTAIQDKVAGAGYFVTFTDPGSDPERLAIWSMASGYIVDRLNRFLRDRVSNGEFAYVWELQGRVAPHLHYMFRIPLTCDFTELQAAFRAQWRKILEDVSDQVGVDLFRKSDTVTWRGHEGLPHVNFKRLTHNMGGYLAKYFSKSRSKSGKTGWHPGRWWGVSYPLRARIKQERLCQVLYSGTEDRAQALFDLINARLVAAGMEGKALKIPAFTGVQQMSFFTRPERSRRLADGIGEWIATGDLSQLCYELGVAAVAQPVDRATQGGEDYGGTGTVSEVVYQDSGGG